MNSIDENVLNTYYQLLSSNLITGMDRITSDSFSLNKKDHFEIIIKKYNSGEYKFTKLKRIQTTDGRNIGIPTIRDRLTIEILKSSLQRKFRVKYPDRCSVISKIISILNNNTPHTIIRLDIKSFFQSIPHNKLLRKLKNSSLLNYEEYELIKKVLKLESTNRGLPQGISVSNILSEIYLEELDIYLRKMHSGINYYCRYVDDIIIVINGALVQSEKSKIIDNIKSCFIRFALELNNNKFEIAEMNSSTSTDFFNYLGYNFRFRNSKLIISMDQIKYKKILTQIESFFFQYKEHHNCELLIEQLKFFTSKKSIFKLFGYKDYQGDLIFKNRKIFFGILENYKEINDDKIWRNLDKYIRKRINVFVHINGISDKELKRRLHSYSFTKNKEDNNIYKLNKLKKSNILTILMKIDNQFNSKYISRDRTFLFKRYFKLIEHK